MHDWYSRQASDKAIIDYLRRQLDQAGQPSNQARLERQYDRLAQSLLSTYEFMHGVDEAILNRYHKENLRVVTLGQMFALPIKEALRLSLFQDKEEEAMNEHVRLTIDPAVEQGEAVYSSHFGQRLAGGIADNIVKWGFRERLRTMPQRFNDPTTVEVALTRDNHNLAIKIKDTGAGVSTEYKVGDAPTRPDEGSTRTELKEHQAVLRRYGGKYSIGNWGDPVNGPGGAEQIITLPLKRAS
jgi:hypothetical protein